MKKHTISILICAVMICTIFSVFAVSASASTNIRTEDELRELINDTPAGGCLTIDRISILEVTDAIEINKPCTIQLKNGKIIRSNYKGSIFKVTGDNVTLELYDVTIQDNTIENNNEDGAGILVDGDNCRINGATFIGCKNSAKGIICITQDNPGCRIEVCTFKNCNMSKSGVICVNSSDCKISHCTFENIYAHNEGRWVQGHGDTEIIKCTPGSYNKRGDCMYYNCIIVSSLGSILSQGSIIIIISIGVLAAGFLTALFIFRRKKITVNHTSEEDEE